jgi:UDP-N-acetylmuramoyl-tripeptide--D-alanyl-D-alanine ligase
MELGMNHAGEISTLVAIAEPNVRVWTNVGDAHLGYFASRDAIADAKAELLDASTPRTLLVANADDPLIVQRLQGFTGRTITFGEAAAADEGAGGAGSPARTATTRGSSRRPGGTAPARRGRPTTPTRPVVATAVAVDLGVPLAARVGQRCVPVPAAVR